MENWHSLFLGLKQIPRDLSAFEIEAFFSFSEAERKSIETRRRPELHLPLLDAEEEDPKIAELRARLRQRIGEMQLPDLILTIDAEVHFSWIMLGREPRSPQELLMAYAGILAHGTAMSAAETARMIPGLTAESVRQAMRWASDEHRLREASRAVLTFMHRHPITEA